METRLVVAYVLIAIMVAVALFGIVKWSQKKTRIQRRDSGRGPHMQSKMDSENKSDEVD